MSNDTTLEDIHRASMEHVNKRLDELREKIDSEIPALPTHGRGRIPLEATGFAAFTPPPSKHVCRKAPESQAEADFMASYEAWVKGK